MSLNPKRLTRAIRYQIDGLDGEPEHRQWHFAGHNGGLATFQGPDRQEVVLQIERLYEVRSGHLHYASDA